jgi:DNA-binding CsgD family transcriptional regulator
MTLILTPAQRTQVGLRADGLLTKQIVDRIGESVSTVENRFSQATLNNGCTNFRLIALYAVERHVAETDKRTLELEAASKCLDAILARAGEGASVETVLHLVDKARGHKP